ncbi:hypothetical protein DPMN_074309 [Dreissena polymorpha]|uniref:SGNH hydrolase-type esterase domain-containing protein n=1 Tax=Dreissena polymorpha TaxID=45954 RepID=A0A9D3YID6_DREPO|nr:hypothetical protein DPMN_074309 [Dreissena polymorpha]
MCGFLGTVFLSGQEQEPKKKDRGMENRRLHTSIAWWGIGGLTWSSLRRSIEANVLLSTPPKVLVLHLGGNDLCIDSLNYYVQTSPDKQWASRSTSVTLNVQTLTNLLEYTHIRWALSAGHF